MITKATSQSGLFAQLEPLLANRAVLITVSKLDGDQLQVNICPRQLKEGENPALTIPLCVTGTAAELDADLVAQIAGFVSSHVGLNSNLNTIEKEIEEAEKAAREDAKKKHKSVGNGGKKAADSVTSPQPPIASKSNPEPPHTLGLFDEQSSPVESELTAASAQSVVDAE
jgi:PRTRC genetic system protein E